MLFEDLSIDPRCLKILTSQKILEPTPVQEKAIPVALEGRDVLAIAQTGTGKTLAFGLPSLTRLADSKSKHCQMLVLTPTRELAVQVHSVLETMGRTMGLYSTCVYGGVSIERQAQQLRSGCAIIVATPGRLLDHINRGNVRFNDLKIFTLDEADRMLDMGFMPDIERIMSKLPKERQTLMFSATFPPNISKLATNLQHDPVRIEIGVASTPADRVEQSIYTVAHRDKQSLLIQILKDLDVGPTLVFLRTKMRTERVGKALEKEGFKAQAIHGDRSQNQRQRAIDSFRKGKCDILVATDVAARGLDVDGITQVINYDLPYTTDDYIHRIGRTARANAKGDAISFVSPEDGSILGTLEKDLGEKLDRVEWDGAVNVNARVGSGGGARGRGGKSQGRKGGRKNTMQQRGHGSKPSDSRGRGERVERNKDDGARKDSNWSRGERTDRSQSDSPRKDSNWSRAERSASSDTPRGDKKWARADRSQSDGARKDSNWSRAERAPKRDEQARPGAGRNGGTGAKPGALKTGGERSASQDEWSTSRPGKRGGNGAAKNSKKRTGSKNGAPKGKTGFGGPKRGPKSVGPKSRKPAPRS